MGIAKQWEVAAFPVRYFFLALVLHALVLVFLPKHHGARRTEEPLSPLQLHLLPRSATADAPPRPPDRPPQAEAAPGRHAGRGSENHPAPENAAPVEEPSPRAAAGSLVEAARHQVREESRQRGSSIFAAASSPAEDHRPNLIARATARRQAGEKTLPGGIIQITTEAGTVYCLQAPPQASPGGLTEALAVPTNCP